MPTFQEIIFFSTSFKVYMVIWNFKCQIAKFKMNTFRVLMWKVFFWEGGVKVLKLFYKKFVFIPPPSPPIVYGSHHFISFIRRKRKARTASVYKVFQCILRCICSAINEYCVQLLWREKYHFYVNNFVKLWYSEIFCSVKCDFFSVINQHVYKN